MNKKSIIIALALALPLTVAALPGDPGSFDQGGNARIERLSKQLGLNADQKTKLDALFKEQHAKFAALHEETRTRMQAILNKEQLAKMDEMRNQHHANRQQNQETAPKATPKTSSNPSIPVQKK